MNRIFITALSVFAATAAVAQGTHPADTIIRASTIEITQVYKPEVKQAVKQEYTPVLPPADKTKVSFDYEVPQQTLYYTYRALPIRPLSMGRDSVSSPYGNYVKAGLGNRSTVYMDAGISALRGKNFESDIHAGFLAQKGQLSGQKQTLAAVNAAGVYHGDTYDWELAADLQHNDFGLYGFDHDLYPSRSAQRQTLTGGRVSAALLKREATENGISFHPSVYAALYTGSRINSETSIGLCAPVTKMLDSAWTLGATLKADLTSLKSEFYDVDNNLMQLGLGADYKKENFALHAYIAPALGQNNTAYLLPDIKATFRFDDIQMLLGGGFAGTINRNIYSDLFHHNPYLYSFPSVQTHSNELFGFIQKGLGNHITIDGRVSWWQYNYLPAYLNDPASRERIYVLYEQKVNAISVQGGLRYQIGNNFSVGGHIAVFNYYNIAHASKVWQTPANRLTADLLWKPLKGLTATAYLSYTGQNYALDQTGTQFRLKSFTDLGFGGEYEFLPRWSLFLNINNLLNSKYQRWYGYPAYGINIYGGLRFKF